MADYTTFNRANWDERVPAHLASPDYAAQRFRDDPGYLSDVVRFDRQGPRDAAAAGRSPCAAAS